MAGLVCVVCHGRMTTCPFNLGRYGRMFSTWPASFLQARMGWKRRKRRPPENALFVSIVHFLAVSSFTEKTALRFLPVSSFVSPRFPFPAYRGDLWKRRRQASAYCLPFFTNRPASIAFRAHLLTVPLVTPISRAMSSALVRPSSRH
jgi:hypothetical protein